MRVFLTGASSGIGEALAHFYAARGDTLGLLARREDHLARLKSALGSPVETYAADVTDLQAVRAAAEHFIARHGVPDIVIGNAGVSHGTLLEFEDDVDVFRQIMDVNVNGVVNTFHPFIAPMKARGSGSLVGIASVAGFRGLPGAGAYSASKAATITFCEALRVELKAAGVQVTTICPGYIATPMTAGNPYPMPFIIPADKFARRCARAIDAKTGFAVIPWPMAIAGSIFRVIPNFIYDRMMAKAGRKPRKSEA
jgi:NAD(P)-dependent dehydrogenase (short-subunit alcohol dehydrogenase family)